MSVLLAKDCVGRPCSAPPDCVCWVDRWSSGSLSLCALMDMVDALGRSCPWTRISLLLLSCGPVVLLARMAVGPVYFPVALHGSSLLAVK